MVNGKNVTFMIRMIRAIRHMGVLTRVCWNHAEMPAGLDGLEVWIELFTALER